MATASYISIPTASSALETPIVQPVRQRSERAVSAGPGTADLRGSALDEDGAATESLKSRLHIDPAAKERCFDIGDVVQLVLLVALGATAVSLPGIMLMKLFSAAAQFSSLDIVRLMAGMP